MNDSEKLVLVLRLMQSIADEAVNGSANDVRGVISFAASSLEDVELTDAAAGLTALVS